MTALLAPAKKVLLLTAPPVNMHDEVIEWLSDLEFCRTELIFFQKLLDKYFLRTSSKKNLVKFNALELKLKTFVGKNYRQMYDAIVQHEHRLSELDKTQFSQDEKAIKNEHKKHKLGVAALMGSVKKIKKELFNFVEEQMKD